MISRYFLGDERSKVLSHGPGAIFSGTLFTASLKSGFRLLERIEGSVEKTQRRGLLCASK